METFEYGFREYKIETLEKKLYNLVLLLKRFYKHQLLKDWEDCKKELEIHLSYKQLEDGNQL